MAKSISSLFNETATFPVPRIGSGASGHHSQKSLSLLQIALLPLSLYLAFLVLRSNLWGSGQGNIRKTPAPGCTIPIIGPWIEAWRFVHNSAEVIENGIRKCGLGSTFKISTPTRWVVVTSNEQLIKELGNVDEKLLSMQAAADERNSISHILSDTIHGNPFHVEAINKYLVRELHKILPDIEEEIRFNLKQLDVRVGDGSEWVEFDEFHNFLSRCISSVTNRVLVGLPLCRDPEFLNCLVQLSTQISRAGLICDLGPQFLRTPISNFLVQRSDAFGRFIAKLGPVFEQRRRNMVDESEEQAPVPNDGIQWILERAPPETTINELCFRILYLNFSAIHTSSISISHAILDLAAHPKYQNPIRREIEKVLETTSGVWSKLALAGMRRLDSTLKESQRVHPVTTATMMRKAQRSCVLSDGTYLSKGQWIVVAAYAINHLDRHHSHAQRFDALRFSRAEEVNINHRQGQGVAYPDPGYLSFGGIGKHACPGRYFVAAELKIMLGQILERFEIRLVGEEHRHKFFSFLCLPDTSSKILLRKWRSDNNTDIATCETMEPYQI